VQEKLRGKDVVLFPSLAGTEASAPLGTGRAQAGEKGRCAFMKVGWQSLLGCTKQVSGHHT